MNGQVSIPSKGKPMTAQWGADVANRVNSLSSFGRNGMLLSEGEFGSGYSPLPVNMRNRATSSANIQPWTFKCTIDPDTEERSGGWYNQVLQIGMKGYTFPEPEGGLPDDSGCADGYYYAEINANREPTDGGAIRRYDTQGHEGFDDETGVVRFFIGRVVDGKETVIDSYHYPIVIYKYL